MIITLKMTRALAAIIVLAASSPIFAQELASQPPDKALAQAKAAAGDLAGRLKETLSAALKEKGAVAALDVCKAVAPQASTSVGEQHNLTIKRTALKIRNSNNAPDSFEARILADFLAKAEAGMDVQSLAYAQVVEANGAKQLRFMKAISMAEQPCAVCHGTQVKPDVLDKIRDLYPLDQATGFLPGQLRGAISVTVKID